MPTTNSLLHWRLVALAGAHRTIGCNAYCRDGVHAHLFSSQYDDVDEFRQEIELFLPDLVIKEVRPAPEADIRGEVQTDVFSGDTVPYPFPYVFLVIYEEFLNAPPTPLEGDEVPAQDHQKEPDLP